MNYPTQAKRLLKHYIGSFLLKKIPVKTEIKDIGTYQVPGEKRTNMYIINLMSENCLDEENKLEIESQIKSLYDQIKPVIYMQAPFSSNINDVVMVNFDC